MLMFVDNIESHRASALKRLYLLDIELEEIYNTIAELAADVCDTLTA